MKEILAELRKRKIMTKLARTLTSTTIIRFEEHVLCSNGRWVNGNSVVPK